MKRYILIIAVAVFILLAIFLSLNNDPLQLSCDDLAVLFAQNKGSFENAAELISAYPCDRTLWIDREDPCDDRLVTIQVEELYFCFARNALSLTAEDCKKLYDAVEPLFSNAGIEGIAYGTFQIQFCVASSYGVEFNIIYVYSEYGPDGSFSHTKEERLLAPNWYALISND